MNSLRNLVEARRWRYGQMLVWLVLALPIFAPGKLALASTGPAEPQLGPVVQAPITEHWLDEDLAEDFSVIPAPLAPAGEATEQLHVESTKSQPAHDVAETASKPTETHVEKPAASLPHKPVSVEKISEPTPPGSHAAAPATQASAVHVEKPTPHESEKISKNTPSESHGVAPGGHAKTAPVEKPTPHTPSKPDAAGKVSEHAADASRQAAPSAAHESSVAHDSSHEKSEETNPALHDAPPMPESASLMDTSAVAAREARLRQWQFTIEMARKFRKENDFEQAKKCLESVVDSAAPEELRRVAFLEQAFVAQQNKQYLQAQKIFSKYIQKYPDDPGAPELMLRQGLLYRDMGVYELALSKFFSVLSAALKIKNDRIDYYQSLVLLAQRQIADTYYLQGNYDEAIKKYGALLSQDSPGLRRDEVQAKLIYCQSAAGHAPEAAAQAELFLERFPDSEEVPEMRFHLASAYKKLNQHHAALEQVLALLKSQKPSAVKNPENWRTWQQRTGNQIASQLFSDGNYVDALTVYQTLAQIETSPRWQLPVLYQVGLIFERLQLPQKANEVYTGILAREKELTGENDTPSLRATIEMAKWRRSFIGWESKAANANQKIRPGSFPPVANASSP